MHILNHNHVVSLKSIELPNVLLTILSDGCPKSWFQELLILQDMSTLEAS